MNSKNVWRQGRSGSSKISSPSFLSSSTLMIRIDLVTALRRSLSRSARSNFSNGIGLASSVESVSADGMDCIRDDRVGQVTTPNTDVLPIPPSQTRHEITLL